MSLQCYTVLKFVNFYASFTKGSSHFIMRKKLKFIQMVNVSFTILPVPSAMGKEQSKLSCK